MVIRPVFSLYLSPADMGFKRISISIRKEDDYEIQK